jgi:hypothetical protein
MDRLKGAGDRFHIVPSGNKAAGALKPPSGALCRMMLQGGTLDRVRILSPKTVALLSLNFLPDGRELSEAVGSEVRLTLRRDLGTLVYSVMTESFA